MLPALFAALAALSVDGTKPEACLYLDDCRDGSVALVDRLGPSLPFRLHLARGGRDAAPNAGAARRAALAMGLSVLAGREGLLFTTDADSTPQPDWIAAGRRGLSQAEVVAGRIQRVNAASDPQQSRIVELQERVSDSCVR